VNAAWADSWLLSRRNAASLCTRRCECLETPTAFIRFRTAGDGPPLILVPDPPNLIEHYDSLVAELAQDYRVLCFDPPGFGFSLPKKGFRFTLCEQAELLITLLEHLGIREATLSIACIGALAGLMAASRRPDLIHTLILLQVASYEQMRAWTFREDVYRIIQTPLIGQIAIRLGRKLLVRHWYRAALPAGSEPSRFTDPVLNAFREGACVGLASAFQAVQAGSFRLDAPISQQVVVLWGTADRTHADTRQDSILEVVPHAQWIEYAGCGHFPDLENEGEFASLLRGIRDSPGPVG
jgi:pimeloyl-ACP methyl ester carboxylesterase